MLPQHRRSGSHETFGVNKKPQSRAAAGPAMTMAPMAAAAEGSRGGYADCGVSLKRDLIFQFMH